MESALPVDASGFVRRECPDCRRAFKTRPLPTDGLALVLRLSEAGTRCDVHEELFAPRRTCPYCGSVGPENAWLTLDQRAYVEELSQALASQANHLQLELIAHKCISGSGPTFVTLPPAASPVPPSYEPDDMVPVYLVCCNEELKLQPGWTHALYCFKCGAKHDRGRSTPNVELPLAVE